MAEPSGEPSSPHGERLSQGPPRFDLAAPPFAAGSMTIDVGPNAQSVMWLVGALREDAGEAAAAGSRGAAAATAAVQGPSASGDRGIKVSEVSSPQVVEKQLTESDLASALNSITDRIRSQALLEQLHDEIIESMRGKADSGLSPTSWHSKSMRYRCCGELCIRWYPSLELIKEPSPGWTSPRVASLAIRRFSMHQASCRPRAAHAAMYSMHGLARRRICGRWDLVWRGARRCHELGPMPQSHLQDCLGVTWSSHWRGRSTIEPPHRIRAWPSAPCR